MINTEEENLCSGPDRNLVDRIYELLYLGMRGSPEKERCYKVHSMSSWDSLGDGNVINEK